MVNLGLKNKNIKKYNDDVFVCGVDISEIFKTSCHWSIDFLLGYHKCSETYSIRIDLIL